MLLGLLLFAFVAAMAQTPSQGDQKNEKADACCAMDSCCCKGDSCSMKKKDMNHADAHECCDCCADSCDMDMKADGTMKHDMKDHNGDCCKAKSKDAKDKNKP
jgi:hypothetical protein